MKSLSTFAMLAALLMFSALGCTESTDTGTGSGASPASGTEEVDVMETETVEGEAPQSEQ